VSDRRLLLVHAHPDDESISNGATMAKYVAEGAKVTLVTCTRGEEGEVLIPELAHLASTQDDNLGEHRIKELAVAMKELGVTDHRFLGNYRDSGMMGTESNNRPDTFWQADLDDAAGLLVKIIREVKPQVLITYDEFGGYGHPDHIKAQRVAMRASELAANSSFGEGEAWSISKIYWNTMPKSVVEEGMKKLKEQGSSFFGTDNIDELPFVKPDELTTAVIDGTKYVDRKMAALAAHKSQISMAGPFFALSNNLGNNVWGYEYYTQVKGEKGKSVNENGWEIDLFA
jgi:N-acetyl-1-D-myo-inositol-2-amino-2-deoxy-alpha-D-glucopyranoside deacetylase